VATTQQRHVLHMPGWSAIGRRAGSTLLVASVLPMAVFYLAYALGGLKAAVGATLLWYYSTVFLRVMRGRPILAATLLGAVLITLRALVAFWTGSAFLYFLQPVLGTVATALWILATAAMGRPLLDRLSHDLCPFPPALSAQLRANSFFRWASVVWTVTYLINAAGTVWLLSRASLGGFLLLKTVLSPALSGLAVLACYLVFRLLLRRDGVKIRWGGERPAADERPNSEAQPHAEALPHAEARPAALVPLAA
jgi:hypothetical protein